VTKTVYDAVKGALQDMTHTIVTTITKAFTMGPDEQRNDRNSDDVRKICSRTATEHRTKTKSTRKCTPIRREIPNESSSESSDEEKRRSEVYTDDIDLGLQDRNSKYNVKLPPFTGEEDWKVWFNRFQVVANRRHWTREQKSNQLLPRLLGKAGYFVFGQLSQEKLKHYESIVGELDSRFRKIETSRSFKLQFNRRDQRPGVSRQPSRLFSQA
jgi:hypothetical protein